MRIMTMTAYKFRIIGSTSNLTDDTIKKYTHSYFIYISNKEKYFKKDHANVLNLNFTDFNDFTLDQIDKLLKFLEKIEVKPDNVLFVISDKGKRRCGTIAYFAHEYFYKNFEYFSKQRITSLVGVNFSTEFKLMNPNIELDYDILNSLHCHLKIKPTFFKQVNISDYNKLKYQKQNEKVEVFIDDTEDCF